MITKGFGFSKVVFLGYLVYDYVRKEEKEKVNDIIIIGHNLCGIHKFGTS